MNAKTKFDLYQHVTDRIIASIEAGTPAWRKPWTGEAATMQMPLRSNGEAYRGINVVMLWLTAAEKGYRSAYWFTYRQAQELGGQVRKGEKGSTVVKFGTIEREDEQTGEEKKIPYLKGYTPHRQKPPAILAPPPIPSLTPFLPRPAQTFAPAANPAPTTTRPATISTCRRLRPFTAPPGITPPWPMRRPTGQATNRALTASAVSATARATLLKN